MILSSVSSFSAESAVCDSAVNTVAGAATSRAMNSSKSICPSPFSSTFFSDSRFGFDRELQKGRLIKDPIKYEYQNISDSFKIFPSVCRCSHYSAKCRKCFPFSVSRLCFKKSYLFHATPLKCYPGNNFPKYKLANEMVLRSLMCCQNNLKIMLNIAI